MIKGIAVSNGYAIGKAFIIKSNNICIPDSCACDIETEKNKLKNAVEISKNQLIKIKDKAIIDMGKENSDIFLSHLMLLDDIEFIGEMEKEIEIKKYNCAKAIDEIVKRYITVFNSIKDDYISERILDVKDVGERLLKNLFGENSSIDITSENAIIVAHELTPSNTACLDKNNVKAILTDIGGKTSHSAIMARTLEIPAVVGLNNITENVKQSDTLIVDGIKGIVIINPSQDEINLYKEKAENYKLERENLKSLINTKTITKNGKVIKLCANVGNLDDIDNAIKNGAEGIGLFRSEFLYMNRNSMPSENEQFEIYKKVLLKMDNKPVIIRTLDVGGDKNLPYLDIPNELNPFLGYRAIRLCLGRTDIFKSQLKALLRASAFGNLKIMFPMISSVCEIASAKKILSECMDELSRNNISYNKNIEIGIMIEIPSAALIADELSKYVDFFSIGTNDLIQYTIAVDRINEKVSYLYNPMHPAVIKLIKMTILSAHNNGILCGMCGEMASDENLIPMLLKLGIDELSMSSSSILNSKKIILNN